MDFNVPATIKPELFERIETLEVEYEESQEEYPWQNEIQSRQFESNRFRHESFGDGTIKASDFSDKWKMLIDFDQHGEVWVIASYVEPIDAEIDPDAVERNKLEEMAGNNRALAKRLHSERGIKRRPEWKSREMEISEDGSVPVAQGRGQEIKFRKETGREENITRGQTEVQNVPSKAEHDDRLVREEQAKRAMRFRPDFSDKLISCSSCNYSEVRGWKQAKIVKRDGEKLPCPKCKTKGALMVFPIDEGQGGGKKESANQKSAGNVYCNGCGWEGKETNDSLCPVCSKVLASKRRAKAPAKQATREQQILSRMKEKVTLWE